MTVNNFRSSGATKIVVTGLLLTLMVFFFLVMRSGSEARAIARAQWASDIEKESEAFCRKFGLAPESNQFSQCAADLSVIRKLHEERVAKEGAGIL
jgi:hypothetical protein